MNIDVGTPKEAIDRVDRAVARYFAEHTTEFKEDSHTTVVTAASDPLKCQLTVNYCFSFNGVARPSSDIHMSVILLLHSVALWSDKVLQCNALLGAGGSRKTAGSMSAMTSRAALCSSAVRCGDKQAHNVVTQRVFDIAQLRS